MLRHPRGVLILVFTILVTGCSLNPTVSASDDFLTIAGQRWRRTGALNTEMLRVGVRRGGPFRRGENAFDSKTLPVLDREIKIYELTRVFGEQTWNAAVDATLDADSGSLGVKTSASGSIKGTYTVLRVMDIFELVDQLNSNSNKRIIQTMASYGADARIIVGVATVSEQEQRRMIGGSASVTLPSVPVGEATAAASFKPSGMLTTVGRMSDGTVFAFEYARICWAANNDELVVASLEVDRPGSDSDCPKGTHDDTGALLSSSL